MFARIPLVTICSIFAFAAISYGGAIEELAAKLPTTAENYCSNGFASPQFSGGCVNDCGCVGQCAPSQPVMSAPAVTPAPSPVQDEVVTPDPINFTASAKGYFVSHTVEAPASEEQPYAEADNYFYRPVYSSNKTVVITKQTNVYRAPVVRRPVVIYRYVVPVPTSGYTYTVRGIGPFGIYGQVIDYRQYAPPAAVQAVPQPAAQ